MLGMSAAITRINDIDSAFVTIGDLSSENGKKVIAELGE